MRSVLRKIRHWLSRPVEPSNEVRGSDRYTAKLIAGVSLAMAVTGLLWITILFPAVNSLAGITTAMLHTPEYWLVISISGLMGIAYILSRTRHYRRGYLLLIAIVTMSIPIMAVTLSDRIQFVNSVLVYSVLPILLTGIVLPLKYVVGITIILLIGQFSLGAVIGSPYRLLDAALITPVQVAICATIIVDKIHRDALQQLAEKKVRESARLERHRIAEEIHDAALQDILLAGRYLGIIKKRLSSMTGDEKMIEYIEACETATEQANTRLRALLKESRLANTIKEPLREMISDWLHLAKMWAETGISMKLDLDDAVEERLGNPATKLALYYIIQEATMNAIRHAHAQKIDVMVKAEKDGVLLVVQDDGIGFDGTGGLGGGIYNMKRRAEEIGGRLTIRKREKSGTVVSLWSSSTA